MLTSTWRKATYTSGAGNCVEVRLFESKTMQVRDTKLTDSPVLDVNTTSWQGFLATFVK